MTQESILLEAERLVNGERHEAYGSATDSFTRIGRMWAALLSPHIGRQVDDIPPRLVAVMMVAFKCSRDANRPSRDNVVDIAGYAELANQLTEER